MAYIHMEWNSKEVSDTTFEKIENYLTEIHGNTYSYRIYSPEIALMNGIGTFLGVVIGYIATYYMDIGLMIGYIKVQGSPMAFVISLCICCFITIVVSGMNYKRLKRKKIIELLNGYQVIE